MICTVCSKEIDEDTPMLVVNIEINGRPGERFTGIVWHPHCAPGTYLRDRYDVRRVSRIFGEVMTKPSTGALEQAGKIVCAWQADSRDMTNLVERIAFALEKATTDLAEARERACQLLATNELIVEDETRVLRERDDAFTVLARHGFVRHAGTWITRDEDDRISKDGP